MEYRRFGPTDITVSALGFGCWEMGGTYGDVTERGVSAAVNRAIDLGINCFDTAPAYGGGESEVLLGRALGARRKDVVVVTKCGVGYAERPKGRDSRMASILDVRRAELAEPEDRLPGRAAHPLARRQHALR